MTSQIITVSHENIQKKGFFCFMSKRKNPGWKEKAENGIDNLILKQ